MVQKGNHNLHQKCNHILITVTLFGGTVAKPVPLNSRSYKLTQPGSLLFLAVMLSLNLFSINSTGITLPMGINPIWLLWFTNPWMAYPWRLVISKLNFMNRIRSSSYSLRDSVNKLTIPFPPQTTCKTVFNTVDLSSGIVYHWHFGKQNF